MAHVPFWSFIGWQIPSSNLFSVVVLVGPTMTEILCLQKLAYGKEYPMLTFSRLPCRDPSSHFSLVSSKVLIYKVIFARSIEGNEASCLYF